MGKNNFFSVKLFLPGFFLFFFLTPLYGQSSTGDLGTEGGSKTELYLPDLTTVIEAEEWDIAQDALPDYYASLPEPPLEQSLPVLDIPVEEEVRVEIPPSVVALATENPQKEFFVNGIIEPAWPLSLFTAFSINTLDPDSFYLDLGYNLVGGYGLEAAEDGYFHNKSFLKVGKNFSPGTTWIQVEGSYRSMDNGLQGRSLLFDDINRRGALAQIKMGLPLGYGFSLEGEIPLDWYNRYAGFSNTVGKTELNGSIALSVLDVKPGLALRWDSSDLTPKSHHISAQLVLDWNYWASLDSSITGDGNRGNFSLGASWLWNSWLELFGQVSLVYLPLGAGSQTTKFLVPFFLGTSISLSPVELRLEGGLDSRHKNYYGLEEEEPYVNFTWQQLNSYSEQSDWFFNAGLQVPLIQEEEASGILNNLVVNFKTEYRRSALGNSVLTGNYDSGLDGWTGLFGSRVQDRTLFSTHAGVTLTIYDFLLKAGWNSQWLYHPEYLPPQNLVFSCNYDSSSLPWGAEFTTIVEFKARDSVPVMGASAYYKPTENLQVVLSLKDMLKLFTGRQRVLIEPYMKEAGSVSLALQFNF